MISRRTAAVDLPRVFDHLADRLATEYLVSRRHQFDSSATLEDAIRVAKSGFRQASRDGRADTLLHEGKPFGIVRWMIQQGQAHTGFAATEEFFSARNSRYMFGYVRDLQRRLGNLPLVASNWSGREDVQRWFEFLGYEFAMERGPAKIFLLRPR